MRALLALALLLASPAFAADRCEGRMREIGLIEAQGFTVEDLSPTLRANVEANYNALPPASDYHLSHAYVMTKGDITGLILVSGEDCVVHAEPVDAETLAAMEKPPGNGI